MKKLTIQEHREMGNALKAFRNEHLARYCSVDSKRHAEE
jgi:hypothetical protein